MRYNNSNVSIQLRKTLNALFFSFVGIISLSLVASPLTTYAQTAGTLNIFGDTLNSNWINASYGSTIDFANASPGTYGYSMKIVSGQWGALSLLSGGWNQLININPADYSSLLFSANGGTTGATIGIFFQNDTTGGPNVERTLSANQWTPVSISMSELNPFSLPMNRITIQLLTPAGTTWYVDDFKFSAREQVNSAPTITSLNPTSGVIGTSVTITGTGFTPTGNKIKFGELGTQFNPNYNLNSSNGTTLTFPVPSGNYNECWNLTPACSSPVLSTRPGDYAISVINTNGTSNALTFTVSGIPIAQVPFISSHPQNQIVNEGQTATFSVTATGTTPLSYQWQSNTSANVAFVNIAGATGSSYTTGFLDVTRNGSQYRVLISNNAGSATSNDATVTVMPAPVVLPNITTQPQDQTVNEGQSATFSVIATGTLPLSYQWQWSDPRITKAMGVQSKITPVSIRVFTDIPGATQPSYNTGPLSSSLNGARYRVIVTNSGGVAVSKEVTLTVNSVAQTPIITTHPVSQIVTVSANVTFSVVATGTLPLGYQWKKNNIIMTGETNTILSLTNVQTTDAGSYTVVVTNTAGSVTSNPAVLTVNPVFSDSNIIYRGGLSSGWSSSTSWNTNINLNSTPPEPQTIPPPYSSAIEVAQTQLWGGLQLTYSQPLQSANYSALKFRVWSPSAGEVKAKILNPNRTNLPAPTRPVAAGWQDVIFPMTELNPFPQEPTFTYFFIHNVYDIRTLYISNIELVRELNPNYSPTITTQPVSQTVTAGSNVTFSVVATGTLPLGYQWKKNNIDITGETNTTFSLTNVQTTDAGSYTVTVTNSAGMTTSNAAVLIVNPVSSGAPAITVQPMNQTAPVNSTATFSVVATGTAPLSYQWQKASTGNPTVFSDIPGATARNATYTTPQLTQNDNGTKFRVRVENGISPVAISNPATLTIGTASSIDRVVLYHSVWVPNSITPGTFNWNGITDLIWFGPNINSNLPFPYVDFRNDGGEAHLRAVIADAHAHNVKVILNLHDLYGPGLYSQITATDASATAWANAVMNQYIISYGFDGIDPDWESNPHSAAGFTTLGRIFRPILDAYDPPGNATHGILTAAIDRRYNLDFPVDAINSYYDYVNIMSYDANGGYSTATGFHEALHNVVSRWPGTAADAYFNIEENLQTWVSHGLPKSKMAVGLALYLHVFQDYSPILYQPGQLLQSWLGPGAVCMHPLNWCEGLASYNSFYLNNIANERLTENYDDLAAMVWVGDTTFPGPCPVPNSPRCPGFPNYISLPGIYANYNSPQSFRDKISWLRSNGYNSIMLFSDESQYFAIPISIDNQPASHTPLLDAVRTALGSSTSPTGPLPPVTPPTPPDYPAKCSHWIIWAGQLVCADVASTSNAPGASGYAFSNIAVKLGTKGAECMTWQQFFNAKMNAGLVADGICGPKTITFAKSWQASVGLVADGVLGALSRAKANQ